MLLSAGGTGGGIYPALAVSEALRDLPNPPDLHFIGSIGGMEESLVGSKASGLFASYDAVYAGPLHGVSVPVRARSLLKILRGTLQTFALIGKYKPRLLFITGGFVTFPVALACWLRRVPIAIYLPDIEPGQAIKATAALSKVVYVTTSESAKYFRRGRTVETGYPLRADMLKATRADGIAHFGLDPTRQTLLVFGGSRGAKSVNAALVAILPELLALDIQIIHVSGELDWPSVAAAREALLAEQRTRYHAYNYLHGDMGLAMAAADLAVSRAGASAMGEFPQFALPAILVPYPFAWRYQKVNADWLASRGAALRMDDEAMQIELLPILKSLFTHTDRLNQMREASHALSQPDGARNIANGLMQLMRR